LRIELEFETQELASWPWEYLRVPDAPRSEFLAQTTKLVLNRTLPRKFKGDDFSTPKPVLLLVVSRPSELGPVEGDAVLEKIKALEQTGQIELHALIEPELKADAYEDPNYQPTASWKSFLQLVQERRPHIIHFIGHGRLSFDLN